MQNKCLYIISLFQEKKETPTQVFSCRICETFKNRGGCFWKHKTYYIIKNYVGNKSAIFNAVLFTLLHLLIQWWDMRLKHDVEWLREEQADRRNVCQNEKKYCSCCMTLLRIDTILSKNKNNFQNLLFRNLLAQLSNQADIFWKLYSPADILCLTIDFVCNI